MTRTVAVVADDLGPNGLIAIRDALALVNELEMPSMHVVHVIDQRVLDKTGHLTAADKQSAAIADLYPKVWKRVRDQGELYGLPDDVSVDLRFAPVHSTRAEAEIAKQLLGVAADFEANLFVLGRRGRPACVTEHLTQLGHLDEVPGPEGVQALFFAPPGGTLHWQKTEAWKTR